MSGDRDGFPFVWLSSSPSSLNFFISVLMHLLCSFALDKKIAPKAANDVKLISAGKILENSKTVGQCKMPFGELPKGVITMHAVVQPSVAKAKSGSLEYVCAFNVLIVNCL